MIIVMFYKLNLPKLDLPQVWYTDKIQVESKKVPGYISYYVTEDVDRQVRSLFPEGFLPTKTHVIAQIIDPRLNGQIHKDARQYAINYTVNTGGLNAYTASYSGDLEQTGSFVQQPGEWVLLNTFENHAVHDITDKRIGLSISFYEFGDTQWNWLNDKM